MDNSKKVEPFNSFLGSISFYIEAHLQTGKGRTSMIKKDFKPDMYGYSKSFSMRLSPQEQRNYIREPRSWKTLHSEPPTTALSKPWRAGNVREPECDEQFSSASQMASREPKTQTTEPDRE